jgi:hypothetical protein
MFGEAKDRYADKHNQCKHQSDDDVAGESEGVGDHPQHVAEQNEDEQGEDEGEILSSFAPDGISYQVADEFVHELSDTLHAPRYDGRTAHAQDQDARTQHQRDRHEQRRVGIGQVQAAGLDVNQRLDLELFERTCHPFLSLRSAGAVIRLFVRVFVLLVPDRITLSGQRAVNIHEPGDEAQEKEQDQKQRQRAEPIIQSVSYRDAQCRSGDDIERNPKREPDAASGYSPFFIPLYPAFLPVRNPTQPGI